MKDLSNTKTASHEHVILIAGDLSGTARTAAFAYARAGNHIVLASSNDDAGLKLTEELRSRNVDAEFMHANTYSAAEIRAVAEKTVEHYGHLDVQYLQ
jgi:NAD(P)-dependent dehydrogenase (short-subunit alcohol dehydrogenase family)